MLHLCTDQGASSTRFSFNNSKVYENPNSFTTVGIDDDIRLVPNSNEFVDCIDLTIEKEGDSDYFPVRVLGGTLAERYSSSSVRPSMLKSKSKQAVNYYSIITAIASAMNMNGDTETDVSCYICLPPVEIAGNNANEDYVKAQLNGTYLVKQRRMNDVVKEWKFTVDSTRIFPESVMAFMAFMFNPDGTQRVEMAKYNKGYVLSFDLGASTLDLALIKDRKFVDHTGFTYKLGGNIVDDMMRKVIRMNYGTEVTKEDIEEVVRTGRLPYGSTYKDMSEELKKCKRDFAKMLFEHMETYFSTVNVSLQSIKAIFISGGGSMPSYYLDENGKEVVTTPSVSEYIEEILKGVCDAVDMVTSPVENPRECNIIGTVLNMNVLKKLSKK